VDAGKLIGVEVLDHIIVGDGRYYSFKEGSCL
jgi:DNA repair protein RadC